MKGEPRAPGAYGLVARDDSMISATIDPVSRGQVGRAGIRRSADGGKPSLRLNVRLRCGASAKPATCAASVTEAPPESHTRSAARAAKPSTGATEGRWIQ